MRRPFILFLLIISVYCWLTDCVNLLFFLFKSNSNYVKIYSNIISIIVSVIISRILYTKLSGRNYRLYFSSIFNEVSKKEWLLLFFISLPIVLLGFFRALYPDQSYDTFHFELYLQEYNFRDNATNFAAASIRSHYFPLPERVFAVFRHVLGFRLGTIFNTILLITIICSVYDFIKKVIGFYLPQIKFPYVLAGAFSLFTIFAENTLFNIGSYKTDLIGVPFILEIIHLLFFPQAGNNKKRQHYYFFLVASLTIACKLTYLPYVGIISLIYIYQHYNRWSKKDLLLLCLCLLLFPGIYMLYNLFETGNPIFPFYNKIFHSAMYPLENFKDLRWGPQKLKELFIYPIVTFLDNARCNEWGLFSYRLLAGYIVALTTIISYYINLKKNKSIPFFRFIFYMSALALSLDFGCLITTGYYRYGIIIEVLYGLIICLLSLYFNKKIIWLFLFLIIFLQSYTTFYNIYGKQINLSWHNYKELFINKNLLQQNAALVLHDYGHIIDSAKIIKDIDGFINVNPFPQDGLALLIKDKVPIYDLEPWARRLELIDKFEKNIVRPKTVNEKWFTVASMEAFGGGVIEALNKRGYLISNIYEIYPDFVKYNEPVFLLQIKYQDTSYVKIKTTIQYLKGDNPVGSRDNFEYNTGHKLKVFIREAPFAFNWDFLPESYEIIINQKKYSTNNRFGKNKVLAFECDSLKLNKTNDIPYLIIVQDIIENKPSLPSLK